MTITHITERESELLSENAKQLQAIRLQAAAVDALRAEVEASERNLEGLTDDLARSRAELCHARLDAGRYQALKRRHGYLMIVRLIGKRGYSSHKSDGIIDAYADAAIKDLAAWNSKTQEEKESYFQAELVAAKERVAMKEKSND